jgi:hypothetical protein
MNDVEALVARTIATITAISRKAAKFSGIVAALATIVCAGSFLLGIAALSGGMQSAWIVLGIVFGAIALAAGLTAWWRVGSIRRHVPEIANEIRALVSDGTSTTKHVIETFDVNDAQSKAGSTIGLSREVFHFKSVIGHGLESSARFTAAVTALTSFPLLMLTVIAITTVFGFLSLIFLLAVAL